jgi:DNA processing protein
MDRAAHLGALARNGATIAVLACGVDLPFPIANRALFDLIVEHGLMVSEWPPGASVIRSRFLSRNRVIAALSAGTIVVESGMRSGSLHTARLAHELGRTLMFTPGPVTSSMSAGVHQLARKPWGARLVTSAEDVIEDLDSPVRDPGNDDARPRAFTVLTHLEQRLIESLPRGYVVESHRIAAAAGIPVETAEPLLEDLEREGQVEQVDDRWRLT